MEHFQSLHVCKPQIEDNAQGVKINFRSLVCAINIFSGGVVVQIDDRVLTEDLMVLHWAKLRYAECEAQI